MDGPYEVELVGGPQDGCRVVRYPAHTNATIWVGRKWMGDGRAAYAIAHVPPEGKPVEYRFDGRVFRYVRTVPANSSGGG